MGCCGGQKRNSKGEIELDKFESKLTVFLNFQAVQTDFQMSSNFSNFLNFSKRKKTLFLCKKISRKSNYVRHALKIMMIISCR